MTESGRITDSCKRRGLPESHTAVIGSTRPDADIRPKSSHTAALQRTAAIYAVTLFAVDDSLERQVHARIEFIQTVDP